MRFIGKYVEKREQNIKYTNIFFHKAGATKVNYIVKVYFNFIRLSIKKLELNVFINKKNTKDILELRQAI